jgi:hypothetical protein
MVVQAILSLSSPTAKNVRYRSFWCGTTDETRGTKIEREQHDAELAAFGDTLRDRAYAWFIVAKRLGVSKDVAKYIGEYLYDRSDAEIDYYLRRKFNPDKAENYNIDIVL